MHLIFLEKKKVIHFHPRIENSFAQKFRYSYATTNDIHCFSNCKQAIKMCLSTYILFDTTPNKI